MFKTKITHWDIIITLTLIVISISCYVFFVHSNTNAESNEICIYINGYNAATLPIGQDGEHSFLNGEFIISIKNSSVRVVKSDCYDRTCQKMAINKNGGEIICLPNNIVIRLRQSKNATVGSDLNAG